MRRLLPLLTCLLVAIPASAQDSDQSLIEAARKAQAALTDEKKLDQAGKLLPGFDARRLADWREAVKARLATLEQLVAEPGKLPDRPTQPPARAAPRTREEARAQLVASHKNLTELLAELRKLPTLKQLREQEQVLVKQQKALVAPKGDDPLARYRKTNHLLAQRLLKRDLERLRAAQALLPLYEKQLTLIKQRFAAARKRFLELSEAHYRKLDKAKIEQALVPHEQADPKIVRPQLDARKVVLEQLLATRRQQAALPETKELEQKLEQVLAQRKQLPEPGLPEKVTDLAPFNQRLAAASQSKKAADEALKKSQDALARAQKVLERLPAEVSKATKALEEAQAAQTGHLAAALLENRQLELLLAQEQLTLQRQTLKLLGVREKLRTAEVALAARKVEQAEILLNKAGEAIKQQLEPQLEALARKAKLARRAALTESDPLKRFRLEMDAEMAENRRGLLEEESLQQRLESEIRLEQREQADLTRELSKLSTQLDRKRRAAISQETVNYLGRRIRQLAHLRTIKQQARLKVHQQIDAKQTALSKATARQGELLRTRQQLNSGKKLEPTDDDELLHDFSPQYRRLMAAVSPGQQADARTLYKEREEALTPVLELRVKQLERLVKEMEQLEQTYAEQLKLIGDVRELIVRRIYWMRTDRPLGLETVARIPSDLGGLWESYTSAELRDSLSRRTAQRRSRVIWSMVGLLVLFSLGLVAWLVPVKLPQWRYRGGLVAASLQQLGVILLIAGLAPACFLGGAGLLRLANLPQTLQAPMMALLLGLAGALFARRFLRIFLRNDGLAERQLGVSEEVRAELEQTALWLTLLGLLLWLPWYVLASTTPPPTALNRVLYSVLLVLGALQLSRLLRVRGPVVTALTRQQGFWFQSWMLAYPLVCLAFVGIVGMDLLGYRIGAWVFTRTVLQLLAAVTLMAYAHALVTRLVARAAYAIISRTEAPPPEEGAEEEAPAVTRYRMFKSIVPQVSHLAGIAVLVIGALLTAWGLDLFSSVRAFCQGVELYRSGKTVLTFWHLVKAACWIVGAHFLLHHLGSIYELLLFPRLKSTDSGTRYVILTLSRYAVLLVSYSLALLNLQINPSSLGWLMAAMSVGIGFGLQEIIANFVSGLILLLERPIKVGDIVRVGDELGVVKKINIRATIVDNFDRLSIIVPNRKLITDNVINWTYADPIKRQTIPVGVAYGTDVQKVFDLLRELVTSHPNVLDDPAPGVWFGGFGESSLDFSVKFFTLIAHGTSTVSELHQQINERFNEEGIEIPFPQRELRLASTPATDKLLRSS